MALLFGILPGPSHAEEEVALDPVRGVLRQSSGAELGQLPPALIPRAVLAEPLGQDLLVLAELRTPLENASFFAGIPSGKQTQSAVLLRYGRVTGKGELSQMVGPVTLSLPGQGSLPRFLAVLGQTPFADRAVALAAEDSAKVWFVDRLTFGKASLSGITETNPLDLAPNLSKISALLGDGPLLYVAGTSASGNALVRLDVKTGLRATCSVDAQAVGLRKSPMGTVEVLTSRGVAPFPANCGTDGAVSMGSAPSRPDPLRVIPDERTFDLSERQIELFLPAGTAKIQRGLQVRLVSEREQTIDILAGTCTKTRFLAAPPADVPQQVARFTLTPALRKMALYAEQSAPGEDCMMMLSSPESQALVRIRGIQEGGGATVFAVDRSFSMEQGLLGGGTVPPVELSKAQALRHALSLVLSTLTITPSNSNLAVLPFSDERISNPSAPKEGLATIRELANPDDAKGLRIRGFAGSSSDGLSPAGTSDLGRAVRLAGERLSGDAPSLLTARRLWLFSDGLPSPLALQRAGLSASHALGSQSSLRIFGIGALSGHDPLLAQLAAQGGGGSGSGYAPATGSYVAAISQHELLLATADALLREFYGARGLLSEALEVSATRAPAVYPVEAPTDGGFLFGVLTPERTEAQAELSVERTNVIPRCVRMPQSQVCSVPAFAGETRFVVRGGGAKEQVHLRLYASSVSSVGQVTLRTKTTQALYRSGDTVRLVARLSERGIPLQLAKVRAKVLAPSFALGTYLARADVSRDRVREILERSGDLSSGQAKAEAVDLLRILNQGTGAGTESEITLNDDGQGDDVEGFDGTYVGSFVATLPGSYRIEVRAEHAGLLTPKGMTRQPLSLQVIPSLDLGRTSRDTVVIPVSQAEESGGGTGRFVFSVTPQDRSGNLFGPGVASSLSFVQDGQVQKGRIVDQLDGRYQVELEQVKAGQAVEVRTPGGQGILLTGARVTLDGPSGCSMTGPGSMRWTLSPLLLFLLLMPLFRKTRSGSTPREQKQV